LAVIVGVLAAGYLLIDFLKHSSDETQEQAADEPAAEENVPSE